MESKEKKKHNLKASQPAEKKVEYLELIYDLIFVYVIGRNNSLLHHVVDGWIEPADFLTYTVCTLAVIQIWNYSTYYINIYGNNGIQEHIFLFVNMFLLYFVGEGTREQWETYHTQYHVAWALILLNIALQYLIEYKRGERAAVINRSIFLLLAEALLVLADIPVFRLTGKDFSYVPIIFGIVVSLIPVKKERKGNAGIDFAHLSERAMLYVVFTFGEMVIAIADYFDGELNLNSIYFSLMAFLIVVGLFLSYGTFYDKIIDREQENNGLFYLLIHVFIVFAQNNITNSLEFMRDGNMKLLPKEAFLIGSLFMFFVFLFLTRRYSKTVCRPTAKFYMQMILITISFVVLMIIFRDNMRVNIAISAGYIWIAYSVIYWMSRKGGSVK